MKIKEFHDEVERVAKNLLLEDPVIQEFTLWVFNMMMDNLEQAQKKFLVALKLE